MCKGKKEIAFDISSAMTTCVTAASALNFPSIFPVVSVAAPVIQRVLDRIFTLVFKENPAKIECARLGIAFSYASNLIDKGLKDGREIRNDGYLENLNVDNYTKADEAIEAAIRSTIKDAETMKSYVFGSFIAETMFSKELDFDTMIQINNTISLLSIGELTLLKKLKGGAIYDLVNLDSQVKSDEATIEDTRLFCAVLHLMSLGVIVRVPPVSQTRQVQNVRTSAIGETICRLIPDVSESTSFAKGIAKYI